MSLLINSENKNNKIIGKIYKSKTNTLKNSNINVYFSDNDNGKIKEIQMEKNEKFSITMSSNLIDSLFVVAPRGTGKTTILSNIARQHKGHIYLFSRFDIGDKLGEEPAFMGIKNIKKIDCYDLFESNNNEPIDIKEFSNSMVIMDDIQTLKDKKVVKFMNRLRDEILESGRKMNILLLVSEHLLLNHKENAYPLLESKAIIISPMGNNVQNKFFLRQYCCLDNILINELLESGTRFITVIKSIPKILITDNNISII